MGKETVVLLTVVERPDAHDVATVNKPRMAIM